MNELTLDTFARRLNRLEREVHRWRLGATILLICIIAVVVMGQTLPKPQVIEAQRFVLKDPNGKVRAILGPHEHRLKAPPPGEPWYGAADWEAWGLHIFGPDGRYRAGLMPWPSEGGGGGYLTLSDKDTMSRADLAVSSGYADLLLEATTQSPEEYDRQFGAFAKKVNAAKTPEEKIKALLSRPAPDISARLLLSEGDTALTLSEKGASQVVLGRIALGKPHGVVEKRPLSSIVFLDKNDKVIWTAP
jgi:hypothetical protein